MSPSPRGETAPPSSAPGLTFPSVGGHSLRPVTLHGSGRTWAAAKLLRDSFSRFRKGVSSRQPPSSTALQRAGIGRCPQHGKCSEGSQQRKSRLCSLATVGNRQPSTPTTEWSKLQITASLEKPLLVLRTDQALRVATETRPRTEPSWGCVAPPAWVRTSPVAPSQRGKAAAAETRCQPRGHGHTEDCTDVPTSAPT